MSTSEAASESSAVMLLDTRCTWHRRSSRFLFYPPRVKTAGDVVPDRINAHPRCAGRGSWWMRS